MIAGGANVHYGPYGFSPLHLAANRDTDDVTSILLAAGANPRSKTSVVSVRCGYFTPLHLAYQKDVIALLMDAAPDVIYARVRSGNSEDTALHYLSGKFHNVAEENPDLFINLLETAGTGALNLSDMGFLYVDDKSVMDLIREKNPDPLVPNCLENRGFVKAKGRSHENGHARLMEWIVERGYDKVDPPAEFLLLDGGAGK